MILQESSYKTGKSAHAVVTCSDIVVVVDVDVVFVVNVVVVVNAAVVFVDVNVADDMYVVVSLHPKVFCLV